MHAYKYDHVNLLGKMYSEHKFQVKYKSRITLVALHFYVRNCLVPTRVHSLLQCPNLVYYRQ